MTESFWQPIGIFATGMFLFMAILVAASVYWMAEVCKRLIQLNSQMIDFFRNDDWDDGDDDDEDTEPDSPSGMAIVLKAEGDCNCETCRLAGEIAESAKWN